MSRFKFNYQHLMLYIISGLLHQQTNNGGSYRIINGINAAITQFPYLISIQRKSGSIKRHICGGAFISEKWILTAAHCLQGETATGLVIRAESSFHEQGGVLLRVSEIIQHNKFDVYLTRDYDYGLIRLSHPFGRAVPAILKNGSKRFLPGHLCQVMGWGRTTYSETSKRVMTVSVPIVSQSTCRSAYEPSETITPRMICAGYTTGEKDACEGDSGGPLMCNGLLTGIISWAEGCAMKDYYGVYSYVTPVRSWIRNITGV
ncbi:trypsin-4-like [Ochlerotatus camptorhynchus]|uniref:trypsin-4-like n=1 Tax=Ochlerotatus camptorhynchus TaxID=644619 RepID=UPI0031D50800